MDQIDSAIAAADKVEHTVTMQQINVTISSTGRPAAVMIPADVTDSELAELAGWMLTSVLQAKRADAAKAAGPKIEIVRGSLASLPRN